MPAISGHVALVGAGPGDPGLLTLRGRDLLARCDVVVYDALIDRRLLNFAPGSAERIYAGKRAAHHSLTQDEINALLVEHGRAGRRVVRLKGGDPFVFGRGGEEAEALKAAGVAFEIVPGITAALAALAYAGIPATHRDLNTSFTFITGHEKERDYQAPEAAARTAGVGAAGAGATDWSALARLPAVAFYMGVKALPRIVENLVAHGKDPGTPAASIQWGTTSRQKTAVGTLGTIVEEAQRVGIAAPAITVVGEVVRLRETISWFEHRPLFGKRILVTRTRQQASELSAKLAELGADVLEAPTIETAPPADGARVEEAIRSLAGGGYDWAVFTSANGVSATREALNRLGLDARAFAKAKIAAVGPATAEACRQHLAIRPDLVPDRFAADELANAFDDVGDKHFLLLRADIGRASLVDTLRARGGMVEDVTVYETRPAASLPEDVLMALDAGEIHAALFTSGSTARNLASLLGDPAKLQHVACLSIGPQTSTAMREAGLQVTAEADQATLDALVEATRQTLA